MRAWFSRFPRTIFCVSALAALSGCEEDKGGGTALDAVVLAADEVVAAIEADPDTYQVSVATGTEINGTINGAGGSATATGWRSAMEHIPEGVQYLAFAEKIFLDLDAYTTAGVQLSGSVVVTRHSLDYGTNDKIDDASRHTHYVGSVVASGAVSGNFVIDVHANASGTTLWTCGLINDEETGSGRCF